MGVGAFANRDYDSRMHWRLGTMGFGYSEWDGVFYPNALKSTDKLEFYAKYFDAVELDTTFHAAPTRQRVTQWADSVPEQFRFCVKTPKAITHEAKLDLNVALMVDFLGTLESFGPKLGVVLLQFPPSFTHAEYDRFDVFLSRLPADVKLAAEFRHPSWERATDTQHLLQRHNVAWVAGDYADELQPVHTTSDFTYIRFIGVHDRYPLKHREEVDLTDRLLAWKNRIEPLAPPVETVWGFFNNDYSGYSIATCNRMKRLLGQPVVEPPTDSSQPSLFGS